MGLGARQRKRLRNLNTGRLKTNKTRAMQAAGMMPGMEQAAYLPEQMRMQVGQSQDALAQSRATAAQQAYGKRRA